MDKITELEQQIEELKTRLADVKFYANAIIRDKNEMDKVGIQAETILTICGDVGEIRTQYLHNELRSLRKQITG